MAFFALARVWRRTRQTFRAAVPTSLSLLASTVVSVGVLNPGNAVPVLASTATSVRIASPLSNQTYTRTISVSAVTANAQQATYAVDGGAEQPLFVNAATGAWESQLDTTLLANGAHTVDVINHGLDGAVVSDRAWNVQVGNDSLTGATPASITIENPLSGNAYAGNIEVRAIGQSLASAAYQVDGGTPVPMTYAPSDGRWRATLSVGSWPSGAHNIDVVGSAANGTTVNDRAWSVAFNSTTVRIASPLSNQTYTGIIPVQAVATNAATVTYRVDGASEQPLAFDSGSNTWQALLDTTRLANGNHVVDVVNHGQDNVVVTDRAWTVQVHNSLAAIAIQNPLSNQSYSGQIMVTAAASNVQSVTYHVDDAPAIAMSLNPTSGMWQAVLNTALLANSLHTVTVTGTDLANGSVSDRAWNISVTNVSPSVSTQDVVTTQSSTSLATTSPTSSSSPSVNHYVVGLIGDQTGSTVLSAEHAAGVNAKIIRLSWKDYLPAEGQPNTTYVAAKRAEIATLRAAGFGVILDLGLQDTPTWLHQNYANSYYVNQFGDAYGDPSQPDQGDANLVFNSAVRGAAANYIGRIFGDLGTDFSAVRLGGGRWGELTYPPASYNGHSNVYWGFDANALGSAPTHNWLPGQPQSNGEASTFINWYLNALVDYQNWQIATVRRAYTGSLMVLYPSWGIRPGQLDEAIGDGLNGSSSAEINGEVERGFDFARQIAAVTDPRVVVTTTWLDADASRDSSTDSRAWSPVKYLASLATAHPLKLKLYGENTGQGSVAALTLAAHQAAQFGLIGFAWFNESELLGNTQYATLSDLAKVVSSMP